MRASCEWRESRRTVRGECAANLRHKGLLTAAAPTPPYWRPPLVEADPSGGTLIAGGGFRNSAFVVMREVLRSVLALLLLSLLVKISARIMKMKVAAAINPYGFGEPIFWSISIRSKSLGSVMATSLSIGRNFNSQAPALVPGAECSVLSIFCRVLFQLERLCLPILRRVTQAQSGAPASALRIECHIFAAPPP